MTSAVASLTPPAPNADAVSVTVHDPCHLKKSLGVSAQPRAVLSMNPGYKVAEKVPSDGYVRIYTLQTPWGPVVQGGTAIQNNR